MNPLLLLIDIQNDYFSGGTMELAGMDMAAQNAQQLLNFFREKAWPIVFIQHIAIRANATFFISGTFGAEIHEAVKPQENETVIIKNYPNSFRETGLDEHLRSMNISDLVICGAMSHMCIDTTTRAAKDLGYSSKLISDACATRDLVYNNQTVKAVDVQLAYMAALNCSFAEVITTEQFLNDVI